MELRISENINIATGIDIVDNRRIRKKIRDQKFIQRVLSPTEIESFERIKNEKRKVEFLAGRFSAKESITKALKFKPNFKNITVIPFSTVQIEKIYLEKIKNELKVKDLRINISISHETNYTVSMSLILLFY